MNYEEKYKEALERARKLATDLPNGRNDRLYHVWDLKNIFPELRESDDEKIRKGLIEHLKELKEQSVEGSHLKRPEHYDAWIAWLEKQGENKLANKVEPRFEVGDCIRYRGDNYKIKDIETTKHGFIYNVAVIGKPSDPEEVKTAIGIAAEKDMVKIEQPSWSEEDDDARDIAIRIIQNGGDNCAGILDSDKALNWLKSLKPQPHWKPSKEQMEALKKRTHGLHTSSETRKALESLINDLEKL